jgi:hypothetical protein
VVWDDETARIYHTRALTGEDLVHELLHVAQPAWSEEEVVRATARVLEPRPELPLGQRVSLEPQPAASPEAVAATL